MNITIVRDSFSDILQKAGYFISNKISDLKIFKGVLIRAKQDGVVIQTTNVNEFFTGEIGGKVGVTGEVLVDYKTLFEIVKNLKDVKITLEKKDNQLVIGSKAGLIKLATMEAGSFPAPTENKADTAIPPGIFKKEILDKITLSCASDEARPVLTGVCLDFANGGDKGLRVVGTDGFRMSVYEMDTEVEKLAGRRVVVSSRSLEAFVKIFKNPPKQIGYSESNQRLVFQGEGLVVSTRLLEGEFPPYEKVIPQNHETRVMVGKEELLEAIRSSSLFAKEGSNMLNLEVVKEALIISSSGAGVGEAVFRVAPLEFEGKENKIVFNYRYLLEFLNTVEGKEVIFEMTNPFAPGVFKTKETPKYLHIIMPIRLTE